MKCSFCEKTIGAGRGMISVKSDGTVSYYCNSKCEKNASRRMAKNLKWTELSKKRRDQKAPAEKPKKNNK